MSLWRDNDPAEAQWPEDPEQFEERLLNRDLSLATHPCLYCDQPVFEQADVCPHCGSFIGFDEPPRKPSRRLVMDLLVGLSVAMVFVMLGLILAR